MKTPNRIKNKTENAGAYSVGQKAILAAVLILVFFLVIGAALFRIDIRLNADKEEEQEDLRMAALRETVDEVIRERNEADRWLEASLSQNVTAVSGLLRQLVSDEEYAGPRMFYEGFVVELQGDEVVLPDGLPEGETDISRRLVERSLASGKMMTGRYELEDPDAAAGSALFDGRSVGSQDRDTVDSFCYLSFGKITDDLIFVGVLPDAKYSAYLNHRMANAAAALEAANDAYGGLAMAVRESEGQLELLRAYSKAAEDFDLSQLDLGEASRQKNSDTIQTVDGQRYRCSVFRPKIQWSDGDSFLAVLLLPQHSRLMQAARQTVIVGLFMLILLISASVYSIATQNLTKSGELIEEQAAEYSPAHVRRHMRVIALVCAVIVFFVSILIQAVSILNQELTHGENTLQVYSSFLDQAAEQGNRAMQEEEIEFGRHNNEVLAYLLSGYPELQTKDSLRNAAETLQVDFIMLFDAGGRETLSSNRFTRFTLNDLPGAESGSYGSLLLGMPSIVVKTEPDDGTENGNVLIGTALPVLPAGASYGAVVMALAPQGGGVESEASGTGISNQLQLMATRGATCFAADDTSGEILYTSDPSMAGNTVMDYGLSEDVLADEVIDFKALNGSRCVVITARKDSMICFFAVRESYMFRGLLLYGLCCVVLFSLCFILLQAFLWRGYTDELYDSWISRLREKEEAIAKAEVEAELITPETKEKTKVLAQRAQDLISWDKKMPEEKAGFVFRICLILMMLVGGTVLLGRTLVHQASLFSFLIHGGWARGLNLFSIGCIVLITAIAYLVNVAFHVFLQFVGDDLSARGQTVCRLVRSFIRYFSAFVVLYLSFEYLGFPTSTIVASLGIVSLALSLGAKDLITDILAGIAIVFERSLHVGDTVEINGKRGVVSEIGIRTTTLSVPVGNRLVLQNHDIKDILNCDAGNSEFTLELKVPAKESLVKIEALLDRELPALGRRCGLIQKGPYYIGVTSIGSGIGGGFGAGSTMGLTIGAQCAEKDMYDVGLFLRREIRLLFEREDIELR